VVQNLQFYGKKKCLRQNLKVAIHSKFSEITIFTYYAFQQFP